MFYLFEQNLRIM